MAASDPTLEFLRDIEDPSLYQIKDNIPTFVAHKRKFQGKDGKVREIEVDDEDLQEIADNYNRKFAESGTPAAIKLGHVRPEEGETSQPPTVGAATDFRVGRFGPKNKPCLLYKSHIRLDWLPEIKRGGYNFRSPEYYPNRKEITGIALLNRDPELDLGMVAYANGDGLCTIALNDDGLLCYSRETNMPDMPLPDPTAAPDATAPMPNPDEAAREDYVKHCYSHPYAKQYHDGMLAKYGSDGLRGKNQDAQIRAMNSDGTKGSNGDGGAGAPDAEGDTYAGKDKDMVAYASQLETRLKRTEAELRKANDRLSKAEQANLVLAYQAELTELAETQSMEEQTAEEFVAKELARVQLYSRSQFDAHKTLLTETLDYARTDDITSPAMLDTAGAKTVRRKKEFGEKELDQVLVYMRQGMNEKAATEKVMGA